MADSSDLESLSVRTAKGASWIVIWRMCSRVLGIISTVCLVRLLPPGDFGLVALAASFSQIVEWLGGIGVVDALVRERTLDRAMYDTGFTLNLIRGVGMSVIIAGEALPVAAFFGDPRLAYILLALAALTLAASLENIGIVDYRRSLAFEQEFRLSVIPRVAGIIAAVGFAVIYRNFWALVVGTVTNRLFRVVLTYLIHPYRPMLGLSAWRKLVGFSLWTWLAGLLVTVRDKADMLVIGRLFGPTQVGIYSVGWEIGSLTSSELVEPLTAALFAGFSQGARSGTNVSEGYFKAISVTFLMTLPLGVGLSMLAEPAIRLALGSRWMGSVPLVQVFALVCMLKVIAYFSSALLNAHGLVRISFRILAISALVRIVLLLTLIVPFGLMGAAMATAGCIVVEEALFLALTFRHFQLRAKDLVGGTWRMFVATGVMAGALWLETPVRSFADQTVRSLVSQLFQEVSSGAAVYITVLLLLWWLNGRPRGAETALLGIIGNIIRGAIRWPRMRSV